MNVKDITIQEIFTELLTNRHRKYSISSRLANQIRAFSEFKVDCIPANELLRIISCYVNEGWSRTENNEGFFLIHQRSMPMANGKFTPEFRVQSHKSILLPGVVYFKSHQACLDAMTIYRKSKSVFELY